MIDHVSIKVKDVEQAKAFYEAALAPLGYVKGIEYPGGMQLLVEGEPGDVWVAPLPEGAEAVPTHLALRAADAAAVAAFYEAALAAGNLEAERYAVVLEGGHALGRGGGQLEAPHRKRRDHAGRMRRGLREVHHRCRDEPHVTHIGDGQRHSELVVVHQVVVPFFDAALRRLDTVAIVRAQKRRGPSAFGELAVEVKRVSDMVFIASSLTIAPLSQAAAPAPCACGSSASASAWESASV